MNPIKLQLFLLTVSFLLGTCVFFAFPEKKPELIREMPTLAHNYPIKDLPQAGHDKG